MNYWLSSMYRKRHQRALNKIVRTLNENLKQDELWFGRFMVRQVESPHFAYYFDKSGATLYATLEFVDRCTGKTYRMRETVNYWRFANGANLYWKMNWFITEHCMVWSEPFPTKCDYDAWRKYNKETRVV